jgi:hypothetical protein
MRRIFLLKSKFKFQTQNKVHVLANSYENHVYCQFDFLLLLNIKTKYITENIADCIAKNGFL